MRRLVEQAVVGGYLAGLDEVNPVNSGTEEAQGRELQSLEQKLTDKELTVEEFVAKLNDRELLACYNSQRCQEYR